MVFVFYSPTSLTPGAVVPQEIRYCEYDEPRASRFGRASLPGDAARPQSLERRRHSPEPFHERARRSWDGVVPRLQRAEIRHTRENIVEGCVGGEEPVGAALLDDIRGGIGRKHLAYPERRAS